METVDVLAMVTENTQRQMEFNHMSTVVMLIVALVIAGALIFTAIYLGGRIEKVVKKTVKTKKEYTVLDYEQWTTKQLGEYTDVFDIKGIAVALLNRYKGLAPDEITDEELLVNQKKGGK